MLGTTDGGKENADNCSVLRWLFDIRMVKRQFKGLGVYEWPMLGGRVSGYESSVWGV